MANQGVEALSTVLAHYSNGGNITQLAPNVNQWARNGGFQNLINSLIAAGQLLDSAVGSLGKSLPGSFLNTVDGRIPVLGVVLSSVSALNNAIQIIKDVPTGSISKGQALALIGDTAGAIGGVALALAVMLQ